jgi:hypothetical protein
LIAIEDGVVPTLTPTPPACVDCLWLVTLKAPPPRAMYWLGDGVWRALTLTSDDLAGTTYPSSGSIPE